MGIYVNNSLVTTVPGASLDTSISVGSGGNNTVVQSWDKCGGTAKTAVPVTVNSSPGKTFYNLQNNTAWKSFGELAPKYDICSDCFA